MEKEVSDSIKLFVLLAKSKKKLTSISQEKTAMNLRHMNNM